MLKTRHHEAQNNIFLTKLELLINYKNPLYLLSEKIPWEVLEKEFEIFYRKDFGRPAKPIRLMVGLLILKQLYNESDESVVARWVENPYWQYFCGEEYLVWDLPCDPSELTRFRQRIGEKGIEKIFEISIKLHGKSAEEVEVIPDTTVQKKNITFPTDTKLHLKIINKCRKLSVKFNIKLRQSYERTTKRLRFETRYLNSATRKKQGRRAVSKIKTIAGRLLREILRKLPKEALASNAKLIDIMQRVLAQTKNSSNKIYSLHEPSVSCIAKGKDHVKYEFGSKVSILITKTSGIIVGALNFTGNPYDGNTLESTLNQSERLRGIKSEKAIVDEGYRGRTQINETEIIRPHQKRKKKDEKYSKYKWKKWFRRRASIEPIISHMKFDHGLERNYLKGTQGDSINLMLSAAAFNFKKLMRKLFFIFRFSNPISNPIFLVLNIFVVLSFLIQT
jgi:IS5 family transposase